MAPRRRSPDADRLIAARLHGAAQRLARRTPERDACAELAAIAGGRVDLLAEVAGVLLGAHEVDGYPWIATRAASLLIACERRQAATTVPVRVQQRRVLRRLRTRRVRSKMPMSAALVIHPDGDAIEVNLQPGADHLEPMREHLRCRAVDCVALTDRIDMWIDDEGLDTKPINPAATALARRHGFTWQNYHGPVLLCGVDDHGDSINLTRDQLVGLLTHLMDVIDNV